MTVGTDRSSQLCVQDLAALRDVDQQEWDSCAATGGAPFFYQSWYLSAYRQYPTQDYESVHHLVVRRASGSNVIGICPAYVQRDPLGVFGSTNSRMLVSHCWQSYHTALPMHCKSAVEETAVVAALNRELQRCATRHGVPHYGFVNVPAGSRTANLLAGHFGVPREIDTLHVLDLAGVSNIEDYLARLAPKVRGQVRRHLRRGRDAGVEVITRRARGDFVEAAARLMADTAEHAGGRRFLEPARLVRQQQCVISVGVS